MHTPEQARELWCPMVRIDAGKYTQAELKPYADGIKRGDLQAIPV